MPLSFSPLQCTSMTEVGGGDDEGGASCCPFVPAIYPASPVPGLASHPHHMRVIRQGFQYLLAQEGVTPEMHSLSAGRLFAKALPRISYAFPDRAPGALKAVCLSRYRKNAFRFFSEMITSWVVPGQHLTIPYCTVADFCCPWLGEGVFTIVEILLLLTEEKQLALFKEQLPVIDREVKLGLASATQARRILDQKGSGADEKTAHVYEHIALLRSRMSMEIGEDVFAETQRVLVTAPETFKRQRSGAYLARIILTHYLLGSRIQAAMKRTAKRRYARIKLHAKDRKTLGVSITFNALQEKELLDANNVVKAINRRVEGATLVANSVVEMSFGGELIRSIYFECVKESQEPFTLMDRSRIKRKLSADVKQRIEQPVHPICSPTNEEEIARRMLVLAGQIKYVRDLPQVHISFDRQTYSDLYFMVVLVRLVRDPFASVETLFREARVEGEYIHDRERNLGLLRKRKKEATVFTFRIGKEPFLRDDRSIDLFQARQYVVEALTKVLGEVRDYNGGMLSKQHELLSLLRKHLNKKGEVNPLLLENFFYALKPAIMRSVMEVDALATLYTLLARGLDEGVTGAKTHNILQHEGKEFLYLAVVTDDIVLPTRLQKAIPTLEISSTSLASTQIFSNDLLGIGYIYRSPSQERRRRFTELVREVTQEKWTLSPARLLPS